MRGRNLATSLRGLTTWVALVVLGIVGFERNVSGADWPCYKADAARSGVTAEAFELPLVKVWTYEPAQPPQPAWPEPGKELHRMDFDYACQPVVVGGVVFFSSSADDTVRALDAVTGESRWRFTVGGPLRFAPHVADRKCYVASDDGFLYCLDAESGKLLWQFSGAPQDRKMLGNGRMISRWPCRSGVLVVDGVLYFTAGMWPSEGIYVYALDAETGERIWCNDSTGHMYREQPHGGATAFTGVCPQGYLLASDDLLLVPSGRTTPAAYDRRTGELVYYQPYFYGEPYGAEGWGNRANGGSWALTAGDVLFSPMHVGGAPDIDIHVGQSPPRPGDGMTVYNLGTGLRELNLPDKHRVLAAGDVLYAVGGGEVQAIDLKRWRQSKDLGGCIKWTSPHPRAYCLALAGEALLVGGGDSITAFDTATGEQTWRAEVEGQVRGVAVADGRIMAATNRGAITCLAQRMISLKPVPVRERLTWEVGDLGEHMVLAADVVTASGVSEGYAVVIGADDARLAVALASKTGLHVINIVSGEDRAKAERERLLTTGLYGSRVVVEELDSLDRLPHTDYFADLVVVSGDGKGLSGEEVYRILRPCGGVLCFPGPSRRTAKRLIKEADVPKDQVRTGADWPMVVRGELPGAGEWRHQWADAAQSGIGQESRVRMPLELLWFGGPGPDRMMSRHWGTSTPLSVAGRVFVTGQHHVIAFDAYNGRELWARELEGAGRRGAVWLSGNFVADDDSVYVAVGSSCHRLDQRTGKTLAIYTIPDVLTEGPAVVPETPAVDVQWPAVWQVLGPFPEDSPPLAEESLRTMPEQFIVGEQTYSPKPLEAVAGVLDFTYLYGGYGFQPLKPGEKPSPYPRGPGRWDRDSLDRFAYAFARINCPTAGRLTIAAGADAPMQWYLDGKPISDMLAGTEGAIPCSVTDHVFSVEVPAGEHVLGVMVTADGTGWVMISAGGPQCEQYLHVGPREGRDEWGFLSVVDGLVLGTCADRESDESKALFALNKDDGSARWIHSAERSLFSSAVAAGNGRVFLLDATSGQEVHLAERRGKEVEIRQSLLALDLAGGTELWRQDDVPPMQHRVQHARGVVVVNANAGYDAKSGKKLWQRAVGPWRPPLIWGDWIIAQPHAYDLRTGEPRMEANMLTGQQQLWQFGRAYGCGSVVGCQNLLYFRSGTYGFFDFAERGTTTFGGVRPGCSVNMIPVAGLVVVPEGSSGCSCSYNFQTSVGLIPRAPSDDLWYVFGGKVAADPIRRVRLNFGAPGDRHDARGDTWLSYPRPRAGFAQPVLAELQVESPRWYHRRSAVAAMKGTDRPWVYGSGLRGEGKLVFDGLQPTYVTVVACKEAPTIDAKLDDACWQDLEPTPFWESEHLLDPKTTLFICRDERAIYFGYRRAASVRDGEPIPFTADQTGTDDAECWKDDDIEILVSDGDREIGLHFGVACGGGRFEGQMRIASGEWADLRWDGAWDYAVSRTPQEWTAEVAIPFSTIREVGIDPASLAINFRSLSHSGVGKSAIFLMHPRRKPDEFAKSQRFLNVTDGPIPVVARRYTVRLHFAELDGAKPGERVFDVKLQDKVVLEDFDIVKEAGGGNRALVKEFAGIVASTELALELVPKAQEVTERAAPIISGMEIVEELTP